MRPLLLVSILFFACNDSGDASPKPTGAQPQTGAEQLTGEWRNTYLKVTMPTYKGSDSTSELEVTESTWEQQLKIKPIRTFFRADGSFNSEHRNLKDSIIYNPAGKWFLRNDTLHMTDTFPVRGLTYRMKLQIKGSEAEFNGLLDWDEDGREDDVYFGKQRKQ